MNLGWAPIIYGLPMMTGYVDSPLKNPLVPGKDTPRAKTTMYALCILYSTPNRGTWGALEGGPGATSILR